MSGERRISDFDAKTITSDIGRRTHGELAGKLADDLLDARENLTNTLEAAAKVLDAVLGSPVTDAAQPVDRRQWVVPGGRAGALQALPHAAHVHHAVRNVLRPFAQMAAAYRDWRDDERVYSIQTPEGGSALNVGHFRIAASTLRRVDPPSNVAAVTITDAAPAIARALAGRYQRQLTWAEDQDDVQLGAGFTLGELRRFINASLAAPPETR